MRKFVQKLEAYARSFSVCLIQWGYQNRWILLITILVALGVHYPIYAYHLQNSDSALLGRLYMADVTKWETQQGRWGLRLIDILRGGINLAPLSAFIMIPLYSVAGILLTRVFSVRSRLLRVLMPLLIVCAPYVAEVERYHYCSAAYALSFLLAVLAVAFVSCNIEKGEIAGALCLLFSLSIYQASLGVTAGLCLMLLVLAVLQRQPWMPLLRRFIIMGFLGSGGYFLVLELVLKLYDTSLYAPYGGGLLTVLKNAPQGIANAYRDFVCYFVQTDTIAQNYYGQRLAYVIVAVLAIIALVCCFVRIKKKSAVVLAVIFLLLIPVAVNITDIISTNTRIQLRMAGALIIIVPFCLAVLEKERENGKKRGGLLMVGGLACILLLRGYIVQINNDAVVMLAEKNKVINLANRICLQLEQNPDYLAGEEVCIVGEAQDGWYKDVSPLYEKASSLAQEGIFLSDPVFNSDGWKNLCWEELGIHLNWCSDERILELCETENFQSMPVYPQNGSIQTINGVVVVKVANIQ